MLKSTSKQYKKKCWKPKCPIECQNNVVKNVKNQSVKKVSKKYLNQYFILVVC
jgi:hypothetical protein